MMADLWPRYDGPEDLASIEAVSLTELGGFADAWRLEVRP
jgi:hypothetical protein